MANKRNEFATWKKLMTCFKLKRLLPEMTDMAPRRIITTATAAEIHAKIRNVFIKVLN